jgi:SH3-like domain-containing protein
MLCAGSLLFAQAAGNKRYVAVQAAEMRDSTGFFAKNMGSLALGTEVTLVSEQGKWSQIRAGNLNGWVASASLSARRVVAAGSTITASDVALAGKGFSAETEKEYKKNGLDYSAVDSMERTNIPNDDLLRFVTEGRLNKGE